MDLPVPGVAKRRLTELLDAAAKAAPPPEALRVGRALEALELAGDSEARGLLKELAGGMPGVWLTEEARAALGRLAPRRTASP